MKRIKDLLSKSKGSRAGSPDDDSRAEVPGDLESEVNEENGAGEAGGDRDGFDSLLDDLDALSGEGDEDLLPSGDLPSDDTLPESENSSPGAATPPGPGRHMDATDTAPPFTSKSEPVPAGTTIPVSPPGSPAPGEKLEYEVHSLEEVVNRLETELENLVRDMKRLEGRQLYADKNIEDLLGSSRQLSKQFGRLSPISPAEAGPDTGSFREFKVAGTNSDAPGFDFPVDHGGIQPGHPAVGGDAASWKRYPGPTTSSLVAREFTAGPLQGCPFQRRGHSPLLPYLRNDYATVVLVMRWIEFLFERVKRNRFTDLLDYYEDIGWISNTVKTGIMAYARGEVQDVTAYEPELDDSMTPFALDGDGNPVLDDRGTGAHPHYRPMDDWRLSAEEHLKSLLFVKKIAGCRIDRDELSSLEQEIRVMKYSLRQYHEI